MNDSTPGYRKFVKKDWIATCHIEAVAATVLSYECRNVILTGGEPMLQQPALANLMECLRKIKSEIQFEVETNGTLVPSKAFDASIDQYNVSPKLENSGNPAKLRNKPAAMHFFAGSNKANFKFVVAAQSDLDEVQQLIHQYQIRSESVWLMPEGSQASILNKRRKWLVEICKKHQYRYSDRLHVQIWGAKKGV